MSVSTRASLHNSDEREHIHTRKPSWFSKLTKRQALTTSITTQHEPVSHDVFLGSDSVSPALQGDAFVSPTTPQQDQGSLVDSCRCCGTYITYPASASKIKCSMCRVVVKLQSLDINKENVTRGDTSQLSYQKLKSVIYECQHAVEPQGDRFKPLEDYLLNSFSSYDILNSSFRRPHTRPGSTSVSIINFDEVRKFYHLLQRLPSLKPYYVMLCALNSLLTRPEKFSEPDEIFWILILFEIPTLPSSVVQSKRNHVREIDSMSYEILKKIIGFLGYADRKVKQQLSHWFARMSKDEFIHKLELLNLYISFRLSICMRLELQYHNTLRLTSAGPHVSNDDDNVNSKDDISSPGFWRSGSFSSGPNKGASNVKIKLAQYGNDWHLRSAGRLFITLFTSNMYYRADKLPLSLFYNTMLDYVHVKQDFDAWQYNCGCSNRKALKATADGEPSIEAVIEYLQEVTTTNMFGIGSPLSPLSNKFKPTFTFCQYPFLLSLGAKISILEYEAKKQMERKAEEAFISSLHNKIPIDVYFRLRVRRDHLTNDSLRCILQHKTEFKKSLRVEFIDEPGIDAGGLKKEWFMLLSKELFNPKNGLFNYNTESNLGWFSFSSIDNNEMYYLVGVVMGLAIYNSTILDLQFPQILYKKLLGRKKVSLEDYIELYPVSGSNLRKLLHYHTEEEFKDLELYFDVTYEDLFGEVKTLELILNGSKIPVTHANRIDYVQRYINFFLNDLVAEQCKPFKVGFGDVIGGNALSLFDSEEIELLLIGDDSTTSNKYLDTSILKVVTKYQGGLKDDSELVNWFWQYTEDLNKQKQKKLLQFITGSDRLPATGIQALPFKITLLNGSCDRLPLAHTCFNEICIYKYPSKQHFWGKLTLALNESEGFGIK